jgi:hypothetical protein
MAVRAYQAQNRQLTILEAQAKEQHAVNIRQMEVLDLQATELRQAPELRERQAEEERELQECEAEARHRAQAEQVFIVEVRSDLVANPQVGEVNQLTVVDIGPGIVGRVRNQSDKPIHDLTFTWHKGTAPWGQFVRLGTLMPNNEKSSSRKVPDDRPDYVNREVFGAVAWFRDVNSGYVL